MRLWHRKAPTSSDPHKSALPGQGLFYIIAAAGVLISLFLWQALVLQFNAHLKQIIQLQAQHVTNDVNNQFELRITALKHMAKHLETNQEFSANTAFKQEVAELIDLYPGVLAVAWLTPALKVQRIYPEKNSALDKLYSNLIEQQAGAIRNTAKKQQTWLSPAVDLQPNEKGVFIVTPFPRNQGFLISIINLQKTLRPQSDEPDYAITVFDGAKPLFQTDPTLVNNDKKPFVSELNLHGTKWTIHTQPTSRLVSAVGSTLPWIALILGISIVVLLAIATFLSHLAKQHAKSLDTINNDLKREITDRLQAEDSKQKLEKALLQGQKLQAIGTLAGGIAHDFNNLLYAIIGYVEMAQEDMPQDSLTYKNLSKVLEASHRGQELIARIMAFSRRQHQEFKPVALQATIENALALLKPTIPSSVTIDLHTVTKDEITVFGDQTRIHQIIVNLINNSVDAMDGEGVITISISHALPDDPILEQFPNLSPLHRYCKVEVSDTGQGMDSNTIERIFEPFFTTKEVGKGTGLGLATVHSIVKEHQGDTRVTSQLGLGTNFTILLPEYTHTKQGR